MAYLHAWDSQATHSDSIWALAQPSASTILSGSADGSFAFTSWDEAGQAEQLPNGPPESHTLGITSLSCNKSGTRALWNSIEGTTGLFDVQTGASRGKYASFVRTGQEAEEPCTPPFLPRSYIHVLIPLSMVNFLASHATNIRVNRCQWFTLAP